MEYSKCVSISGYMLSALLYDHNCSHSDQEGFLIGDVIIRQTESISDNQLSLRKEETIINIYSHVPCQDVYSFYTYSCDIDIDKLQFYLKDRIQDVVGWYRFRRHSPLTMSLREKTIHKKLLDMLSFAKRLVFGLFTSHVSENAATHTFDHVFYLFNNAGEGSFEPVSLNIVNLEDSTQDEYRLFPRAPINTRSSYLLELNSSTRGEEQVLEPVALAEDINTALLDKIEGLVEQVSSSEAEIGFLALDIKELEEKIAILSARVSEQNEQQDQGDMESTAETENNVSVENVERESENEQNVSVEITENESLSECKDPQDQRSIESTSENVLNVSVEIIKRESEDEHNVTVDVIEQETSYSEPQYHGDLESLSENEKRSTPVEIIEKESCECSEKEIAQFSGSSPKIDNSGDSSRAVGSSMFENKK